MKLYYAPGACSLSPHIDLAPYPPLMKYAERIRARPKVQEALRAEGLLREKAA